MESAYVEHDEQHYTSGADASPFFMSSRAPPGSPQPWELHDVDFLLPGPMSVRPYFQDSARRFCASLHESEIAFTPEPEDTTKPLAFHAGVYWQDMELSEPTKSELSVYFIDDVFSDRVPVASKTTTALKKLAPPAKLRVNATACFEGAFAENLHRTVLKEEASVVSPTMVDKKILVTDNDLRLFSAGSSSAANMRTLRGRKTAVKKSPRVERHDKKINEMPPAMAHPTTTTTTTAATPSFSAAMPRQHAKRQASLGADIDDRVARPLKRTKSADQSAWSAPDFEPRWYYARTEGFHGMAPRLLNTMSPPTPPGFSAFPIFRPVQHQAAGVPHQRQPLKQQLKKLPQTQYSVPKRTIGIYSPPERRERLRRFHEKRKLRVYHKRIKYDCRKRLANSCPRIKGRFVRKAEFLQVKESDSASPVTSESASSTEDCKL
ncbi:hypothetical protein KRP22_009161 [Phytophthora ramorum]|uniref:Two-component response regulator-like APRR1 n=1 Tax=Phytophthora ramorum TaxID=164328 RepID=UPI0030A72AE1|nr:Two-component response regulator-like APRR1 [Phytophthora ramorum]KAH7502527.1 Two-component response regulator-like APRR1 [Phytophthora ramorum]